MPATRFAILEFFGFPGWTPPDLTQLAEYLSGRITVSRYGGTALRQLRAEHPDGAFAASLIDLAHRTADDLLREDALARVRADIASLEDIGTGGTDTGFAEELADLDIPEDR